MPQTFGSCENLFGLLIKYMHYFVDYRNKCFALEEQYELPSI